MRRCFSLWPVWCALVLPIHATASTYQILPDSSVTQCPAEGSLAPCVTAPVTGVIAFSVFLSEATLDTSGAPLMDPGNGSLDIAAAIWSRLDQLIGMEVAENPPGPFPGTFTFWQFAGTIENAPIHVGLTAGPLPPAGDGSIGISGGTDSYEGSGVTISVQATLLPEPGVALLLFAAALVFGGIRLARAAARPCFLR